MVSFTAVLRRSIYAMLVSGFSLVAQPSDAARLPDKPAADAARKNTAIRWQPWSDAAFVQARHEGRYVLLDLEAVWCHWCHVMEGTTYHDADVAGLIGRHYVALKVDQDARPDLARRYDEYGWPATVIFAPDGQEIVKRRGYIPPERMAKLLRAVVDDPSPIKYLDQASIASYSTTHLLPDDLRENLTQRFVQTHDFARGGMRQQQKYLDRDTAEYALMLLKSSPTAAPASARKAIQTAQQIARQDLDGALKLVDPVWGGVYQYSTHGDWQHPHYEKLLLMQADYLRLFALGHMVTRDAAYLQAARDIHRYVTAFLMSPDGAFYVSQDADLVRGEHSEDYFALDDVGRRKLGTPAIDRHLYAREQGAMIQALTQLYSATLDTQYLQQAVTAAQWTMRERALPDGGFRHDADDDAGPYLEDTIAMGRALLALYAVTGERQWLSRAQASAEFARKNFTVNVPAGYSTAADRGQILKPKPQIDENIAAARFFNLLARYTGDDAYRRSAERAMRYLVTREVALLRATEAGILLAEAELANDPVHLTVVGAKDDPTAQALHRSALSYAAGYRRIEWWDRREGPLPAPDVQYPELPKAAAFVCTPGACSLPQFDAQELLNLAARLERL